MKLPVHGGDIAAANQRFGAPEHGWIDLSTGINPDPYPFEMPKMDVFVQMPYLDPAALDAARIYYDQQQLLLIPGTQAVIARLPEWLVDQPMLMPDIGYQEYRQSWDNAGRQVVNYSALDAGAMVRDIDDAITENPHQHLLVINPNNPTGLTMPVSVIRGWAERLQGDSVLVLDEAFIDLTPEKSLAADGEPLPGNVLLLRSFGKFFGLAGLRMGALMLGENLWARWHKRLTESGLWVLNGPAQAIATQAWKDPHWQRSCREQNGMLSSRLYKTLLPLMLSINSSHVLSRSGMFLSYIMAANVAAALYIKLGEMGILTRLVPVDEERALIRFGLLSFGAGDHWFRLEAAVRELASMDLGQLRPSPLPVE